MRQCPVLRWWNRSASLSGPRATAAFCRSLSGILYFFLLILFSDQSHASTHFFPATPRLVLAMDLGAASVFFRIDRYSPSRSTPRASGSSAASFAAMSRFLVSFHPFMRGAPPQLDSDAWSCHSQLCNPPPCF